MDYSLNLLTVASVFLVSLPVEAVVIDGLSVANEEVMIAQGEGRETWWGLLLKAMLRNQSKLIIT